MQLLIGVINWIFDVWHEGWMDWNSFDATGPGKVYITGLHASPNKVGRTSLVLEPGPCP